MGAPGATGRPGAGVVQGGHQPRGLHLASGLAVGSAPAGSCSPRPVKMLQQKRAGGKKKMKTQHLRFASTHQPLSVGSKCGGPVMKANPNQQRCGSGDF